MHMLHNLAGCKETAKEVGAEAGAIAACVLMLQRSRSAEVAANA